MVANRDEVKVLINYLCSRGQWTSLLNLIEKIFVPIKDFQEQSEILYTIIRNLSKASMSDDLIEQEVVKRIYRLVIRPVRTDLNWQTHLSMETEFGPSVEILGFDISLRVFETFVNEDSNLNLRDYARSRWIANAEKKVEYFRQRGEEVKDIKLLRDLSQRKKNWVFTTSPSSNLEVKEHVKAQGIFSDCIY